MSAVDSHNDTNINHVILWFLNFDIQPEEITKRLNLTPTKIALKGHYSVDNKIKIRPARNTYWEYEWKVESNDFVGDLADKFIDEIIKPRVNEIKSLSELFDAEFKIVQYYYDGHNPGYHFTLDRLLILTQAGLNLDIDTFCLTSD